MFVIKTLFAGIGWVTCGIGGQDYSFPTRAAAKAFIVGHWTQFGDAWKARNLRIEERA